MEALRAIPRTEIRILDLGDIMSLIEQAERSIDQDQREKFAAKLASGDDFTLEDFLMQLREMKKLGPLENIMGMLPGGADMMKLLRL